MSDINIFRDKDINEAYTKAIAKYLDDGLVTMLGDSGSQNGELQHIDFTDGHDLVRVLVERHYDGIGSSDVTISVNRFHDRHFAIGEVSVIWNDNYDERDVIATFHQIGTSNGERVYTDDEGYKSVVEKRTRRIGASRNSIHAVINPKRVIPILRNKPGYKRAKPEDILCVSRTDTSYLKYVIYFKKAPSKRASSMLVID